MNISLALLAGGLATRLRPVTEKTPKSMLEIAGKPFIDHQLCLLERHGFEDVVICAGYLGEHIESYVGTGRRYGMRVRYSFDGDKMLGTGGALLKALPLLPDSFFVMYGDSYLDCSFMQIWTYFLGCQKKGLMTVYRNDNLWDRSNVVFDEGKIIKYDKRRYDPAMHHIDYGLGILSAEAFAFFSHRLSFDLAEVYEYLVERDDLPGYEVWERFYEIGSFEGFRETEAYLREKGI